MKRIGELYRKKVVQANPNKINKTKEILLSDLSSAQKESVKMHYFDTSSVDLEKVNIIPNALYVKIITDEGVYIYITGMYFNSTFNLNDVIAIAIMEDSLIYAVNSDKLFFDSQTISEFKQIPGIKEITEEEFYKI